MVGRTQLPILLRTKCEDLTTAYKVLHDLQPHHLLDSFPITLPKYICPSKLTALCSSNKPQAFLPQCLAPALLFD